MPTTLEPEVLQDEFAVSAARVIAAANRKAQELGVKINESRITVSQQQEGILWRINYGPKHYIGRRGGDVVIDIDPNDLDNQRVLFGQ